MNQNTNSRDLLSRERQHMSKLLGALTVTAASGFITYLVTQNSIWEQWTYLLHTAMGIYLTLVVLPYVRTHFKRTLGIRRPVMVIVGLISVGLVIGVAATGLHITIFGQSESLRWIYNLHIITAISVLAGLAVHVFGQRLVFRASRNAEGQGWFPSITAPALAKVPVAILSATALIVVATLVYKLVPIRYNTEAVIQPYEKSYGEHPFHPSQTETASKTFVDVRQISNSDSCGECHADIARQWRDSIHSQAASDTAYQTNVNLLSTKKGMATTRYCEGCHAPVALLTGQLTKGGKLDTPGHLREGVNCKTCHGISEIEHLRGVASFKFTPSEDYLFANRSSAVLDKIHNFVVRIQPRQHRKDMARGVLSTPQMCATCHAQFMDKDVNSWGWVKMQDDFTAWLNSPYSGQGVQTFSKHAMTRCQDCHMPLTEATDPSANAQGLVRAHFMPGANTAIPWHMGNKEQLQRVTDFLQSDKVRVSFERPSRLEADEGITHVAPKTSIKTEAPPYYYLGETVDLSVIVTNVGVGHDFPGGTSDINEAWVHLRVVDSQQNVIFESGGLTPGNDVDPKAQFYRALAIDRSGNHVWRHDLFNMVGDSYKKVIPAGESDIVTYSFSIPNDAKTPLFISATVRYRKLNNQYARWALKRPDAELPIIDVARSSISLPLRDKPKVVSAMPKLAATK